jgi:hypothetical protein
MICKWNRSTRNPLRDTRLSVGFVVAFPLEKGQALSVLLSEPEKKQVFTF